MRKCTLSNIHIAANHSSGRLLTSLQSMTPIKMEHSDEGGKKTKVIHDPFKIITTLIYFIIPGFGTDH